MIKTINGYARAITGNFDNKRWDVLVYSEYGKIITITFDDRDIAWEVYGNPVKIEIGDNDEQQIV